mmetsp:Transcript_26999/g.83595  ORF Transcript_26999/g.83595 Transcript_26999/m.83595 type:complete len:283 (+) Transcript_26999:911-1759(+)
MSGESSDAGFGDRRGNKRPFGLRDSEWETPALTEVAIEAACLYCAWRSDGSSALSFISASSASVGVPAAPGGGVASSPVAFSSSSFWSPGGGVKLTRRVLPSARDDGPLCASGEMTTLRWAPRLVVVANGVAFTEFVCDGSSGPPRKFACSGTTFATRCCESSFRSVPSKSLPGAASRSRCSTAGMWAGSADSSRHAAVSLMLSIVRHALVKASVSSVASPEAAAPCRARRAWRTRTPRGTRCDMVRRISCCSSARARGAASGVCCARDTVMTEVSTPSKVL